MAVNETSFVAPLANVYEDSVLDTVQSDQIVQSFNSLIRYGLTSSRAEKFLLEEGETRVIDVAGAVLADPRFIMIRVTGGTAELQVVAKDYDGVTTINSYQRAYGTSLFPGFIILSTYNINSLTLSAVTDVYCQIFDSIID